MIYRFPIKTVRDMVLNQIGNNFFKSIEDETLLSKHLPEILEKFEKNISNNNNKYYWRINEQGEKEAFFDPLHNCQWTLFLYLAANTIYKNETEKTEAAKVFCDKIYGQMKIISGCDLFYEVEMPDVFSFDHPSGSYIGRGKMGNNFKFTHDCTVGGIDGVYPVIGDDVTMKAGSSILGNSHVGNNCEIAEGTMVKNFDIPDNSFVVGKTQELIIMQREN